MKKVLLVLVCLGLVTALPACKKDKSSKNKPAKSAPKKSGSYNNRKEGKGKAAPAVKAADKGGMMKNGGAKRVAMPQDEDMM